MRNRATILGLATLVLVASQCFAACSFISCTEPAAATECHQTPGDPEEKGSACAQQTFVTESADRLKAGDSKPDAAFAVDLPSCDAAPTLLSRVRAAGSHSPPPLLLDVSITILRV